jgi:hypothetical protein
VAVVEVDRQVAVHQAERTERARQHFQVVEAVTLDHDLIQGQEVAEVEPQ